MIVKTVGVCIGDWMFDKGTPSLASLPKSSNRAVKEVAGCARVLDLDLYSRDAKKSTCCYSPSRHLFHKKNRFREASMFMRMYVGECNSIIMYITCHRSSITSPATRQNLTLTYSSITIFLAKKIS